MDFGFLFGYDGKFPFVGVYLKLPFVGVYLKRLNSMNKAGNE